LVKQGKSGNGTQKWQCNTCRLDYRYNAWKTVFHTKVYTDAWDSYVKYILPNKHRIGKDRTWKIERKNLNFRTHLKRLNRKTICFSKNEQIHENIIGMYIESFYYKTGIYGNN
jgi:IS1 family transposase